jgi:hypothetical protein
LADHVDGDGGEEEGDDFRDGAHAGAADAAGDAFALGEGEDDEEKVHGEGDEGDHDADGLSEEDERRDRGGAGDEGHAERDDAEVVGELAGLLGGGMNDVAGGEDEEDESAGDLEVGGGDAEGAEDGLAEEEEKEGDTAAGPGGLRGDLAAALGGDAGAHREEDGGEADGIDRDEERDEGLEELAREVGHEGRMRRRREKGK